MLAYAFTLLLCCPFSQPDQPPKPVEIVVTAESPEQCERMRRVLVKEIAGLRLNIKDVPAQCDEVQK